jgi:hypothetical protein
MFAYLQGRRNPDASRNLRKHLEHTLHFEPTAVVKRPKLFVWTGQTRLTCNESTGSNAVSSETTTIMD